MALSLLRALTSRGVLLGRALAPSPGLPRGASVILQRRQRRWVGSSSSGPFGSGGLAAGAEGGPAESEDSHLLQSILSGVMAPYWESTPTAEAVVSALESKYPDTCLAFDHFAFRTFGVEGLGIASAAQLFTEFGYQRRDEYHFPSKKLRAYWYSPPDPDLPRVFVSELKVEELSAQAQGIIRKYVGSGGSDSRLLGKYGLASSLLGVQPWAAPSLADFSALAAESEYAAWVLCNGYALNHTTIAVHRLEGHEGGLEPLVEFLQGQGFLFNEEGGVIKASPDGGLLQAATVADRVSFSFADGEALVPGAYIEFAERRVLPQYAHLEPEEVQERHRRDGFEASSADRIFESTSLAAQE